MDIKRPIYWHQGQFLQPQHFQLADLHQQYLQRPVLDCGLPHFWGLAALDLAEAALGNRNLEVNQLQAVFRDGSFVEFPGNAVLAPRSFDTAWVAGDKPFTVYLGIRKLSELEGNVTLINSWGEAGSVNTRYVTMANPEEVRDLYADGPSAQVKSLSYVVRVFWETELGELDDYELIPLALLERDGEMIKPSERFIPPAITLGGAPALLKQLREIRDEVAGRSRQLEEYKSPREMQKAEFDASYMVYLLAMRSLNRYVPLLFHYAETRQVHPWQVYGTLRQLIGELSSFSERYSMLGETTEGGSALPAYDHLDIGKCLSAASTLIGHLLNEITVGPDLFVRLERDGDVFSAQLPKNFIGARGRYYVVMRTEAPADEVLASFEAEAKLAAIDQLGSVVQRALPGVELIHMPVAPQGLPRRSYSFYFRVEQVSEEWEDVEKAADVALYWAAAPDDLKVEIVGLRR